MNISIWKRTLLLLALLAWPGAAGATELWAPSPTAPFLPNTPNYPAPPYLWGGDTFGITATRTPGSSLVVVPGTTGGNGLTSITGDVSEIHTQSDMSSGRVPPPVWTGSTAFVFTPSSPGSTDAVITYNPTLNPTYNASTGTISKPFGMAWLPSSYVLGPTAEDPTYPIVSTQATVKFGAYDSADAASVLPNTVDIGLLGNPNGSAIRNQSQYVPGCTFEHDMGSVWLSVTQNSNGTANWAVEAREDPNNPTNFQTLQSGTLASFDNSAWYLMQMWYNYANNSISAALVKDTDGIAADATNDVLVSNLALNGFEPNVQGYGFQFANPNVQLDNFAAVPEPSSYALAAMGLGGLGLMFWRRGKNRAAVAAAA